MSGGLRQLRLRFSELAASAELGNGYRQLPATAANDYSTLRFSISSSSNSQNTVPARRAARSTKPRFLIPNYQSIPHDPGSAICSGAGARLVLSYRLAVIHSWSIVKY